MIRRRWCIIPFGVVPPVACSLWWWFAERYACGMQDVFLWEIVGNFEILCVLKTSQNISKIPKNSHNTQLHPRRRRAASVIIRKHCILFPGYQIAVAPFGENGYFHSSEPKVKSNCYLITGE